VSPSSDNLIDAVVVGSGPAGLNAALVLGRARRSVLVIDDGVPRNEASHDMHGFLSRDGTNPAELRRIAREQLGAYPTVAFRAATVSGAELTTRGCRVHIPDDVIETRKLLLAIGVKDWLPSIAGFERFYGWSVFHCPYCDGWESREQPLAVVSQGAGGMRQALNLLGWSSDIILCTQGPAGLDDEQRTLLASHGIMVYEQAIVCLEGEGNRLRQLRFSDGVTVARRILFFHGDVALSSTLPVQMGCALTEQGRIEVDEAGRTSLPAVFAAGDAARRPGQHPATQVILAAASGALAGITLHQELMHEDVGFTPALPRAMPNPST